MADRVRYNMDCMAGLFHQLEEADIFSKVSKLVARLHRKPYNNFIRNTG